jgi:hypothetical protein
VTNVITQPTMLAHAAVNLAGIGSAIKEATTATARRTTALLSAANDEVSTAIAKLFGSYGQKYQAASAQVVAFHDEFTRALSAAANAYTEAETAAQTMLNGSLGARVPIPTSVADVALVMGASGTSIPPLSFLNSIDQLFVQPLYPGFHSLALNLPNELYPSSGVHNLTFDKSVAQGLTILDNAIMQQIDAGNKVVAFGYSQSSTIATLEMRQLAMLPPAIRPPTDHLSFVLVADPNNPNGGLFERFNGLRFPSIDFTFTGATPDNLYPTTVYTREYDGWADFPRYPINMVSDLNALLGVAFLHGGYADLTPAQVNSAIPLSTEGPTNTQYYMIPTEHLPLLNLVRDIPIVGTPIADLVEPDLRVIVNLGYGDPNYGYSTSPANVPTPFGLFPHVDQSVIINDLVAGAQQGANTFANDIGTGGLASLPGLSLSGSLSGPSLSSLVQTANSLSLPAPSTVLSPASLHGYIDALQSANTNFANTITNGISKTTSFLLPATDIAIAVAIAMPTYDLHLFLDGIQQAIGGDPVGLINAIGYPIAADTALIWVAALPIVELALINIGFTF